MKIIFYLMLLILFLLSCTHNQPKKINDIIQPVSLEEGVEKRIAISDLFSAEHYRLIFTYNENFAVKYDSAGSILRLKANDGFAGLDALEFTFENHKYHIPVTLSLKKKYTFTYKPAGKPKSVNLFGQFNNWNKESLPMTGPDEKGVYKLSIPLKPGRYEYKFYVDGIVLIDPQNPVKEPSGLDDFNSVVIINHDPEDEMLLRYLNYEVEDQVFKYNYHLEARTATNINETNIFALLDNQLINPNLIKTDGNKITLLFPDDLIEGDRLIRLAVRLEGKFSNFQATRIIDGKPVGNHSPQNRKK
jgi:hypothetical protein